MKISNLKTRIVSLTLALCMIFSTATFKPAISHAEVAPANWVDDKETERYWPIPDQGRLVKVSTAETLKNPSLRYIGGYTRPDGREVVRLAFSGYLGAVTDVWLRLILKPDNNLNQLIDWDKSGIGKKRTEQFPNNHDGYNFNKEFIKFEPLSASQGGSGNLRYVSIGEKGTQTVRTGLLGVNFETPIDLVLKKGATVKNLKENPLIQMRLMDSNFESIYSTTIAENEEVPYSSYTMSTFVPVRVDLKKGILNTDVARNTENTFQSASSYIKYNEEKGYVDVYTRRTQGAVGSTADSGGAFNAADKRNEGDYGFMQTFDKSFVDILKKQDESGTVAQIFAADSNDKVSYPSKDPTVPLPANRIDYSINDIEKIGDIGVVKVTNNTPDKTFMRTGTTLTGYGTSTVVRYFIDKNKLKESFGGSDIVSYEFFSTVFATNPTGIEEFKSVPRDEDIDLRRGDTIDIRFDGRRDLITLGSFDTNGSVIQIGDDQYKFGIRTTGDKASYSGGGITWNENYMRKMTVSVPFDIKIKKDTPLTIFSRKTKLQEVSPGMTVTFNYSAKADNGSDIKKNKTYRFNREFKNPGYTINENGEVFYEGKKINKPNDSLFKDNHDPLMVSRQENFGGGILTRTADAPDIDEIFTDSKYLSGRSKYDRVYVYPYDANKNEVKTAKRLGTIVASDQKIEMNVNGEDVQGFEWTSASNDEDHKIDKNYWSKKDMPIYFTNQDVLSNSLESKDPVMEQVQATVKFDLNDGTLDQSVKSYKGVDKNEKPGTELAYITDRSNQKESVVRIVPMNSKFANEEGYKANGFEGNNINLKDHNGKKFEENIKSLETEIATATGDKKAKLQVELERTKKAFELRKFVSETPKISGKTFLGWTTKPLTGTAQEVTEAFTKLKVADSVDKYISGDNLVFTSTSPVTENMTVYAAYGSPLITFHTNPPKDLKGMTDETITQSLTEGNINSRKVRLQKNWGDSKFKMEGYSLVGYSTNPDADIPDTNKTGTGVNVDDFLRDGDQMKLTEGQARDGVELYAVWKKNHHVDVEKKWENDELKNKNYDKIFVGLIARPAVGGAGFEVVDKNAVYRPVVDSVKALSEADEKGKIKWENLPSYDEGGHRMSYIAVELTKSTAEKFKKGSVKFKDYGATIVNTNQNNGKGGYKVQLVNTDGVDAMSAATRRQHYDKDNNLVDPNTNKNMKYFDTYGYSIILENKRVSVQPPTIDDIKYDATQVVVRKVGDPNKIVTTLPDGKTITVIKKQDNSLEFDKTNSTFTGNVTVENGVITIATGKLKEGSIVKAQQFKAVGEEETPSEVVEAKVQAQPTSHPVQEIEQLRKDKEGNAVVEFNVPNSPTLPPLKGSKYTLGYMKEENGTKTFVPLAPVDAQGAIKPIVLEKDMVSDDRKEVKKQILIPENKYDTINKLKKQGIKLVIKSDENGKKPSYSKEFELDLTAPTADAKPEEDLWRRWVDLDLSNFNEESERVIVTYVDMNNRTQTLRFDNKPEVTGTVNMLSRLGYKDIEVTIEDMFGNSSQIKPKYDPTTITDILMSRLRKGKNYVMVKTTDPHTTVTVRVYKSKFKEQVMNNRNYYNDDGQEVFELASKIVQKEIDQPGTRPTKISLDDYKLEAGDIVEVLGTTDGGANNRTNPLIRIVK